VSWRRAAAARALALAAALACALATGARAQDATASTWQLQLHSIRHSDALRLADFDRDDWQAVSARQGRNVTMFDEGLRLETRRGAWTWALLARSQATLVADEQTLNLARDIDGGRRPAADLALQVQARLRGTTGGGVALGREHVLGEGWRAGWELQGLTLARWLERRLAGPVQFRVADGSYDFALHSAEIDNRLDFPFRRDFARRGSALLLAATLAWDGDSAWARAGLHDGGWLRWRGMPQQDATLDTTTQAVDADGFLIYQPLVEGRNTQDGLRRRLPWRASVAAGVRVGPGQRLGLQAERLPDFGWLPAVSWQTLGAAHGSPSFGARWHLHERRLVLLAGWRGFNLRAGADRLGAAARSRELALGYSGAF
jgi:hypothetical protein